MKVYVVMADRLEEYKGHIAVRSTCLYGIFSDYQKAVDTCKELEEKFKNTDHKYKFYHLIRDVK